ncbi:mitochondrial carrier domain-containing protein [Obelidium mucronatum]|nr:mitochondrial carrier domain-containing protein [Obelidium mucronatum]
MSTATAKPSSSISTASGAKKPKKNLAIHLLAGGVAGCCEALTCHPLDTIKVRLQLRGERASKMLGLSGAAAQSAKTRVTNFVQVGMQIAQKEGFFSLYKGLGAVLGGIIPKMAIRFSSFEYYKDLLADKKTGVTSSAGIFMAGLGAGITESILVVTPMDVIKIRLQAQRHSMTDPLDIPKYRNAPHCAYVMIKEEGFASLYKGVALTALRQSTNQAANFTVYSILKSQLESAQGSDKTLPAYQHLLMGFVSGACGPLFNAPIDVIKTRIQKNPSTEKGWTRFVQVTSGILKNEGWTAFYKGTTPRVLRVAPGQAITFMVYERVYKWMVDFSRSMSIIEAERVGITSAESNEQ